MLRKSVKTFFELPLNQRFERVVSVSRWRVHTGQDRLRGIIEHFCGHVDPTDGADVVEGAKGLWVTVWIQRNRWRRPKIRFHHGTCRPLRYRCDFLAVRFMRLRVARSCLVKCLSLAPSQPVCNSSVRAAFFSSALRMLSATVVGVCPLRGGRCRRWASLFVANVVRTRRRARGLRRMEQRCDFLGEPRTVTHCSGLNQMVVIVKVTRSFGSGPCVAIDVG